MNADNQTKRILQTLSTDGFIHLADMPFDDFEEISKSLGDIIHITDVKVNESTPALVTSARGLDFHTDHSKADIIAWYCLKQSSEGGESVLVDSKKVLGAFSEDEIKLLSQIQLREHKMFEGDKDSYPLLTKNKDGYKCYYSFWLVNKNLQEPFCGILKKFQEAIKMAEAKRILLKPKDVLLIDNGRIFHGRTEIKGDKDRFLKRFWISNPQFA